VSDQVLIKGARLYGEGDAVDVLVSGGVISRIGAGEVAPGTEVIEAAGHVLLPGLVDLHTHLREPGREDTETIASGSAAAALGGYTAVFAMANTDPVADNAVVVEHVRRRGREAGLVDVHPVGAVTVGLMGEKLAELGTMARSVNVRMFSDDGVCVADPLIMRRALEYSTALGVVIAQHAEEPRLTVGAQAHEGERAARLGFTGWPASAEESIVARDCLLAAHAKARLHVCHVSTSGTVDVLRWAKARGTKVSAEVTPHHLLLTDERLASYDPVNKVNPPLRTEQDTERLRAALAEGVIDCVATDHAPHAVQDKDCEWSAASPGMLGLQTALSIVVETMVRTGLLDWRGVARVMSERPAEIARLPDQGRPLAEGEPANLVLIDPDAEWTVRSAELASIAANTPYDGMRLPGVVSATLLRGRITSREGKLDSWTG
jgi:dihydroorotase